MLTDFENILKENCFILTNKHKKQELNYHLRNCLAHVNIEFKNNNVIFTDINPTNTTEIFEFTRFFVEKNQSMLEKKTLLFNKARLNY